MKSKIKVENIQLTAETKWYEIELSINKKKVFISRWISSDRELGLTDEGFEILDESDKLTKQEKEEIEEYISEIDFSKTD